MNEPKTTKEIVELLRKQMALLAEKSKQNLEPTELCAITKVMMMLSEMLFQFKN